MELETGLGVAAFVLTAVVGLWAVGERRPPPALVALRAWAASGGHSTRGDGLDRPFEVVGERAGRLYTIAFLRGRPDVLWFAVDCDAAGEGDVAPGQRLSDGALVSRVQAPPVALCADPLPAVEALAAAAADLELRVTARSPPE